MLSGLVKRMLVLRTQICSEEVALHTWVCVHRAEAGKWNKIARKERVE